MTTLGHPTIRNFNPKASFRLFCFGHAGAGTVEYRGWTKSFDDGIDICPVVLPGRETRLGEPTISDLPTLAQAVLQDLSPVMRKAPFAFYGHSMGAWVAYEVSQLLNQMGRSGPRKLIIGARRAPHLPATLPALSDLNDSEFLSGLQERYGALPAVLLTNKRLLSMFLPALRADFAAIDNYRPQHTPLSCDIVAIGGRDDASVSAGDLRAWSQHTTSSCTVQFIDGAHFFHKDNEKLTSLVRSLL